MAPSRIHYRTLQWTCFLLVLGLWWGAVAKINGASVKGLYVGNEFYAPSSVTQEAARSSGFNRLFLCFAHVEANGDLTFNSTPVVQNGRYVGDPTWGSKLGALTSSPSLIERCEIVVGGKASCFLNLKKLIESQGQATNSVLAQNFRALKEATGVDTIQIWDEEVHDASSCVAVARMLAQSGLKVTFFASGGLDYWTPLVSSLGPNLDAIYLQCYQSGASNNVVEWKAALPGTRIYPGLWGNTDTPSTATGKMRTWQTTAGVTGGFMYLNGWMPGDSPKWAQALAYGLDPLCSFRIVNKNSGKAIGLSDLVVQNGSTMDQWRFNPDGGQQWSLVPTEEGDHYKIMSWTSGKCGSIAQSTTHAGGRLWAWDYNGDPSQQFDIIPADPGWVKLRNVRSGLVLEVAGGSLGDNAAIQQNVDTGAANQQWKLYPDTDALLTYENFEYPAGTATGQNGGEGWNGSWLEEIGSAKIQNGNLLAGRNAPDQFDSQSSGNSALVQTDQRFGRYLDCSLNGIFGIYGYLDENGRVGADGKRLYISFLQQPGKTSLFYEFELNRETKRVAGIGNDTLTSHVNLRAPDGVFTPIGQGDTNVNFYVVRIDYRRGNDDIRVYRNPTSRQEPASPTLMLTNMADLSFDRISLAAFANTNWVAHDQIRIATSWDHAIASAPESVTQSSSSLVCDGAFRRARLTAQVIHGNGQIYYLMDGAVGMRALLSRPTRFEPGDVLDVVGLVQRKKESMLVMEAVAKRIGHSALPSPLPLVNSDHEFDWVWVEGSLLKVENSRSDLILKLQVGMQTLQARLHAASNTMDCPLGSRIKLTGVYLPNLSGHIEGESEKASELLLNSISDIEIISRPPWWTFKRIMIVLGLLLSVLGLALFWIRLLQRKVEQHAQRLKREIMEREEAERARIIEEERSRISRDLHDDLGSLLTQVRMLATVSPGLQINLQIAQERIGLIAEKSYHMIVALDEVVWMMNPKSETLSSLAAYLSAYTEEFLAKTDIKCRVEAPISFPKAVISAEERNHLFSSVKESLNNAVRHGKPRQIQLKFAVADGFFEVQIRDDGQGFDLQAAANGNGLTNLRTRMQKIKGHCKIESVPGCGTTVSLQFPLINQSSN